METGISSSTENSLLLVSMPKMRRERRHYPRVSLRARVQMLVPKEVVPATSLSTDISLGGIRVWRVDGVANRVTQMGEHIWVSFELPNGFAFEQVLCSVVFDVPRGNETPIRMMGLCFVSLSEEQQTALKSFLAKKRRGKRSDPKKRSTGRAFAGTGRSKESWH